LQRRPLTTANTKQTNSRLSDSEQAWYVKIYAIYVNTSRTPEEGAHSPSLPNGLIIIIIIIIQGSWRYEGTVQDGIRALNNQTGKGWVLFCHCQHKANEQLLE